MEQKKLSGNFLPRFCMTVIFFLIFIMTVSFLWPEGREVMQLIFIPGTPEETFDALETFVSELDCGISIAGAASDFLQKLIQ